MKKSLFLPLLLLLTAGWANAEEFPPREWLGREWFGIYLVGEKAGYGYTELAAQTDGGHRQTFFFRYRVGLPGGAQDMETTREMNFDRTGQLQSFSRKLDSPLGLNRAEGKRGQDGFFVLNNGSGTFIPSPPILLEDCYAENLLARNRSAPGTEREAVNFDIDLGGPIESSCRVENVQNRFPGGVDTPLWEITTTIKKLGIELTSIIDGTGKSITSQMGDSILLKAESEQQAKELSKAWDYLNYARIEPDAPLPAPEGARTLGFLVYGLPPEFDPPTSTTQKVKRKPGGEAIFLISRGAEPSRPPPFPVFAPELAQWTASTPIFQAEDPAIAAAARRVAGKAPNSYAAAVALNDWVFSQLEKQFLLALPDARSVLNRRAGDCKSHSVLLVALARSLGIPARLVAGVAPALDGAFYYHQWVEVWTGEWIALDPAFGQARVEPDHIVLFLGEVPDMLGLAGLLGRLRISPFQPGEESP